MERHKKTECRYRCPEPGNEEKQLVIERKTCYNRTCYAGMAELADALDLGSSVPDVQVQVLLPAWNLRAGNVEKSMFLALFALFKIEKVTKR